MSKRKSNSEHKKYSLDGAIIGLFAFILFPYILAVFVLDNLKIGNSLLTDISFALSLLLGIIYLIASIACIKYCKYNDHSKASKAFAVINVILSLLLCIIGIFETLFIVQIFFPYITVLLDIFIIAFIPLAAIVFFNFAFVIAFRRRA
jgi:hypothetical protein